MNCRQWWLSPRRIRSRATATSPAPVVATWISLALAVGVGFSLACSSDRGSTGPVGIIPSNLAACDGSTALFSALPVPLDQIAGWVPVGAVNPPGHTFPTDHQYIYLKSFVSGGSAVPLTAPGRITITGARSTSYSSGSVGTDYSLNFMPCANVYADFGHVASISPELLKQLGAFDQQCTSYSPNPGLTVTACYTKSANISVDAGTVIGETRGLDLSLFDNRIAPLSFANAARWVTNSSHFDHFHVVAFSDYYAEPMRSTVRELLGSFDGRTKRTVEPRGGTIASDVVGSAQGSWLMPGQPTYPESPHLAVIPDNVDPSRVLISVGTSLPSLASGAYVMQPVASGLKNRAPATITPGAAVYCWEIGYSATDRRGALLAQLADASTLKVEARAGASVTCDALEPYTLTGAAVTFVR